jgi:hypothetical protein
VIYFKYQLVNKTVIIGVIVILFTLTATLAQLAQATPIDANCVVDITGGFPRMYPGQFANLRAVITGESPQPISYVWTVEGDIIKDYDDNVITGAAPFEVSPPTPMSRNDFRNSDISFYWKPESDTSRTVTVRVQTANGICNESRDFVVAHGNNINTQATDFYVARNHPEGSSTRVLQQHQFWHDVNDFSDSSYNGKGDLFFDFHRAYIDHFNKWRQDMGYPLIGKWDPGTPIPRHITIDHLNRNSVYNPAPIPSWFIVQPGGDGPSNRPANRLLCERADAPTGTWPQIQDALNDFPPNLKFLGCTLTAPYHNNIHVRVGGDMRFTNTSPLDEIFWMWHNTVNAVADARRNIGIVPIGFTATDEMAMMEANGNVSLTTQDSSPPRIWFQNPFRLQENTTIQQFPMVPDPEAVLGNETEVRAITVSFDEPVSGVRAADFIVNNITANQVSGNGTGPYIFTGFTLPSTGTVNVTVASGNIVDNNNNKFEGAQWNYTLFAPNNDADNDGISNIVEVESFLTDPGTADTDEDTISDKIEADNPCLDPLSDDSQVMDMAGNVLDEDGPDDDLDGVSNIEEFKGGTDPCGPLPPELPAGVSQ